MQTFAKYQKIRKKLWSQRLNQKSNSNWRSKMKNYYFILFLKYKIEWATRIIHYNGLEIFTLYFSCHPIHQNFWPSAHEKVDIRNWKFFHRNIAFLQNLQIFAILQHVTRKNYGLSNNQKYVNDFIKILFSSHATIKSLKLFYGHFYEIFTI